MKSGIYLASLSLAELRNKDKRGSARFKNITKLDITREEQLDMDWKFNDIV